MQAWAKDNITSGSVLYGDKCPGFKGFIAGGCLYHGYTTTGNKHIADNKFKWVNTILGNIKRSIDGTYHSIR